MKEEDEMKRQALRKLLSGFLAVVMAITILPVSAMAVSPPEEDDLTWVYKIVDSLNADIADPDQQYRLAGSIPMTPSDLYAIRYRRDFQTGETFVTETVMFIVPGAGASETNCAIPSYSSLESTPWGSSGATGIYIAAGVTGIGDNAFSGMSAVEQVTFEDASDLTSIGDYAFSGMDSTSFVDEGNEDDTGTLDLSGVTDLGTYAFNGCSRLTGVKFSDQLTEIPDYAFNNCNFDTIDLPDSITAIGDYAFARPFGSPNTKVTSLTIPQNVKTIGAHAFYGYTGMVTVEVESEILEKPGSAAFGEDPNSAYSNPDASVTITSDGGTSITYEYTAGTTFHTPNETIAGLFDSSNSYQGNLTPMVLTGHQDPKCEEEGYDQYSYTLVGVSQDGEAISLTTTIPIARLGHDWGAWTPMSASCENDGYFYRDCQREGCTGREQAQGKNPDDPGESAEEATGHQWQYQETENPNIAAGTTTSLIYTCVNPRHDNDRDDTDSPLELSITGITLEGVAGQPISSLNSQLQSISGELSITWADEVDASSTLLTVDTTKIQVKAQPIYTIGVSEAWQSGLTIAVTVERSPLDLRGVTLEPVQGYVGETAAATVLKGADGINTGDAVIEYWNPETEAWQAQYPDWTAENVSDDWQVRATFPYDTGLYVVDQDYGPTADGYTVTDNENGTVTITHSYRIIQNAIQAGVELIRPEYQASTPQNTVRLTGLPVDCTITWTDSKGQEHIEYNQSAGTYEFASYTDAGTYPLDITITKDYYTSQTIEDVQAVVLKQEVSIPEAAAGLQYMPGTTQIGVAEGDLYELEGTAAAENAGSYTATAVLTDQENYRWEDEGESGDGEVTISWSIAPQRLTRPTLWGSASYSYTGNYYQGVANTAGSNYSAVYDQASGRLTVYYVGSNSEYAALEIVAYTVTDAVRADAGTYTPVVDLSTPNFAWSTEGPEDDYTMDGSWTISPRQVTYPTLAVTGSPTYDGQPFDEEGEYLVRGGDTAGLTFTGYEYATSQYGPYSDQAPTNAGTYYVRAKYTVDSNSSAVGENPTRQLTIQRRLLTLQAPYSTEESNPNVLPYVSGGQTLTSVKIVGEPAGDDDLEALCTIRYAVTRAGTEGTTEYEMSPTLTEMGTYTITASLSAGNYRAESVTYYVTIGQGNQDITLTPAEGDAEGWSAEDSSMTKTLGQQASFTVTGQAAIGEPEITYAVTSESGADGASADIIDVESSSGLVTIKGAGSATVTVTAGDDPGGLAQGMSVTYRVTIQKGEAEIDTAEIPAASTYGSAPDALEDYQKATVRTKGQEDSFQPQPAAEGDSALAYQFYRTESGAISETESDRFSGVPTDVGEYFLRVDYPGDQNYNAAYAVVKITISNADVGDITAGYEAEYDGGEHDLAQIVRETEAVAAIPGASVQVTESAAEPGEGAQWQDSLTVKDVADSTGGTVRYWYKIAATGYTTQIGEVIVRITPKDVTISGEPVTEKIYDGNAVLAQPEDGFSAGTGIDGESVSVTASGTFEDANAGTGKALTITYTLTPAEGTDLGNYTFDGKTAAAGDNGTGTVTEETTGTITQASLTVTGGVEAVDRPYDGTTGVALRAASGGILFGTGIVGDDVSVVLTGSAAGTVTTPDVGTVKEVGGIEAADFELSGEDRGNYTIGAVTVSGITVEITPVEPELTFDGAVEGTITVTFDGEPLAEADYRASVQAPDTVTDGSAPAGTVSYRFYTDDSYQTPYTNAETDNIPSAAGTYYLEATYAPGNPDNYSAASARAAVVIRPAGEEALRITENGYSGYYDGQAHPAGSLTVTEADGSPLEGNCTVYYRLGETGEETTDPDALTVTDAGIYSVAYRIVTDNYGEHTGTFEAVVSPAEFTLSSGLAAQVNKTYDGDDGVDAAPAPVLTVTAGRGARVEADFVSITADAAYDSADVTEGNHINVTYTVTFRDETAAQNYTYKGEGTQAEPDETTLTVTEDSAGGITPRTVTVTAQSAQKVYGAEDPALGHEVSEPDADTGLLFGDTVEGALDRAEGEDVTAEGYAITGANLSVRDSETGEVSSNYTINFVGNVLMITPLSVHVAIGSTSGTYGSEPSLDSGELLSTDATLPFGETVSDLAIRLTARTEAEGGEPVTATTPVGADYVIVGESGNGNYSVTFTTGTYAVTQRPVTIEILDQESFYGGEIAGLATQVTQGSLANGEDLGIVLATTADADADAGTYPIYAVSCDAEVAANYAITWAGSWSGALEGSYGANGTYTVKPAALGAAYEDGVVNGSVGRTVNNDLIYTNTSTAETLPGKPEGVTVTYSVADPDVAEVDRVTGAVTPIATGNITVTATISAGTNTNYTADSVRATYTLHVSAGSTELDVWGVTGLTYDGREHTLVQVSNPNGISITYTVTKDGEPVTTVDADGLPAAADAGTYHIVWEAAGSDDYLEDHGQFDVVIAEADLEDGFAQPSVQIEYDPEDSTYGSEDNPLNLPADYAGEVTIYSTDPTVAGVTASGSAYLLSIRGLGTTTITAVCEKDGNYNSRTFSFSLTVGEAGSIIQVTRAEGYSGTYDGQLHDGISLEISAPEGYTVRYGVDNGGLSFDLETVPQFRDAGSHTVFYQIRATGSTPVRGQVDVQIDQAPITPDMIRGVEDSYPFTGGRIQPDVSVVFQENGHTETLTADEDYTVEYGLNTDAGTDAGSVTVTATEDCINFTGSATVYFDIAARDTSYLSAELDRYFGYAGDPDTNHTAVAVFFNNAELTYGEDYTVACSGGVEPDAGGVMTFTQVGPYTITVTPVDAGDFTGEPLVLTYTLLPAKAEGGLLLNDGESGIYTYGDDIDGTILVETQDGAEIDPKEYELTYDYYPNEGREVMDGEYAPDVLQDAGLYVVTATGKAAEETEDGATGRYEGRTGTFVFLIKQRDLSDPEMTIQVDDPEYTGSEVEPDVTVTGPGDPAEGRDYTVDYRNNVDAGTGYALITAQGNNFTGMVVQEFSIRPAAKGFTVDAIPDQDYDNGNPVEPEVTVRDADDPNIVLTENVDYTVTYSNNTEPTTQAAAVVTGINNYAGAEETVTFIIKGGTGQVFPFELAVGRTRWTYDGSAHAESITVTYNGSPLTINSDYALHITTDGTTTAYTTEAEAINAMVAVGTYTVTATGLGAYDGRTDSVTVTISSSGGNGGGGGGGSTRYIIDAEAGSGGSISPDGRVRVSSGDDQTFRITADEGYAVSDVIVDGDSVGAVSRYTFENVREDHTIEVIFRLVEQLADPDATGVADLLNTVDHDAFLNGFGDGGFHPDADMTRGQVAQMFYNLLLEKDVPGGMTFQDVPDDMWCAEAVRVISALGIVNGYSDGTFRPDQPITRAQFAAIAMRFADTDAPEGAYFTDVPADAWYYEEVTGAAGFGWINGYSDGTFRPNATVTRAQVAAITNRMLGRVADQAYIDSHSDELRRFTDVPASHWAYYSIMEAANRHDYSVEDGAEYWQ